MTANGEPVVPRTIKIVSAVSSPFQIGAGGHRQRCRRLHPSQRRRLAGNGGTASIVASGGGITFRNSITDISVQASAGGGKGGSLTLDAAGACRYRSGGTINASAGGPVGADFDGGNINIKASALTLVGGGHLNLLAGGVNSGFGGTVQIETFGSGSSVFVGAVLVRYL